jgi:hypothetical protein
VIAASLSLFPAPSLRVRTPIAIMPGLFDAHYGGETKASDSSLLTSSSDRDSSHRLTRTYARDETYYMQDIEIVILVRRDSCVK